VRRVGDPSPGYPVESALAFTVEFLCSDGCLPRLPGTPGGLAARRFVEEAFGGLGLEPAGEDGYLQHIPSIGGANVIGRLQGRSDRTIIVGAHFDACAIDGGVNPGASDNAASIAVMLEVGRAIVAGPHLGRNVVFVGFDAEEPPYFQTQRMGSRHFVNEAVVRLESIDLMICLDMIGHSIGRAQESGIADTVFVLGAGKSPQVKEVLARVPDVADMRSRRLDIDVMDQVSDYAGFQDAGIPFLFYNKGRNEHYHATTDTPETLDLTKMAALVRHLTAVVTLAADAPLDPFCYEPGGSEHGVTIETIRMLLPTLPTGTRFTQQAPKLLEMLGEKAASTGLTAGDWQLVRRIFLAIEDGLLDARLW
jgi:hypothetical protein